MKVKEVIRALKAMPEDHDVVAPIGMDCAIVKSVQLAQFNDKNGNTVRTDKFSHENFRPVVLINPVREAP